MALVHLAFSGGIESTYLLHKLLSSNNRVKIIFANLTGGARGYAGEMLQAKKIIDWFKTRMKEEGSVYHTARSHIDSVHWHIEIPYLNAVSRGGCYNNGSCSENVTTSVTQQFALIQLLSEFRKSSMQRHYPSTVLGWIKEDASNHSLDEYDFSEAEYQELLNYPVRLGRLSNSDLTAKPFRAPLWDMKKIDIWNDLDDELKELIIPNGKGDICADGYYHHGIDLGKKLEFEEHGIPFKETYKIPVPDNCFGFFIRLLLNHVTPQELGLPEGAANFVVACRERFIRSNYPVITESQVEHLKDSFKIFLEESYKLATSFSWPVPVPTIEVFADVGDGAERVELLGER